MLDGRLTLPIGAPDAGKCRTPKTCGGYRSAADRRAKQRRRDVPAGCLARLKEGFASGKVSLCAGSNRLVRARHHLEGSGFEDKQAWRQAWVARCGRLSAPGRSRTAGGNSLLRVDANTGQVAVVLPGRLAHLANHQPRGATLPHRRFDAAVSFSHRGGQWRQAVADRQAVTDSLRFDPQARRGRGGWRLTAVSAPPEAEVGAPDGGAPRQVGESAAASSSGAVVGVGLHADHLACRLITDDGSPTWHHTRIPLGQAGTARQRDARMREAVDQLLSWTLAHVARRVAIEHLDLATQDAATVRETTRSKTHRGRRTGLPTGRLRHRPASISAARRVAVSAVDATYSTVHGRKWWSASTPTISDPECHDDQTSSTQEHADERGRRRPRQPSGCRGRRRPLRARDCPTPATVRAAPATRAWMRPRPIARAHLVEARTRPPEAAAPDRTHPHLCNRRVVGRAWMLPANRQPRRAGT